MANVASYAPNVIRYLILQNGAFFKLMAECSMSAKNSYKSYLTV